jgi:integrase
MQFLTYIQTAEILNISKTALAELVNLKIIPYSKIITEEGVDIKFNPDTIKNWLKLKPNLSMDNKKYVERLKKHINETYPESMEILKEFNKKFTDPYEPKGYYLVKINNKKIGFVYYVRYIKDGRLIPSKWCTHTNDKQAAENFAVENREKLLKKYFERDTDKIKTKKELYSILKKYYSEGSSYLQIDIKRGRAIGEKARIIYHNFIIKQFIPYLRKERITNIEQIDTPFLARFQNKLLNHIRPQTINHYISYISMIFDHLLLEGQVKINPCKSLVCLKIGKGDQKDTGCYEIDKIKGVFNKIWKDEFSYLLCLLIYTTGIRNSEIERMRVIDLFLIDNHHFIDIPDSKTKNGIRIIPLHEFVYKNLSIFINKNRFTENDYIFKKLKSKNLGSYTYETANLELGLHIGYTAEQLKAENITFYSGRHFWKTLMNSENLGDIEEYFMGHKISGDVAERYNHRDKQGKKKLLEKTKKVFDILDRKIFKT